MKNTRVRKNLGDSGERIAALFLEQHGYKIIARNWRSPTRAGEMDLIGEDIDGLAFIGVRIPVINPGTHKPLVSCTLDNLGKEDL